MKYLQLATLFVLSSLAFAVMIILYWIFYQPTFIRPVMEFPVPAYTSDAKGNPKTEFYQGSPVYVTWTVKINTNKCSAVFDRRIETADFSLLLPSHKGTIPLVKGPPVNFKISFIIPLEFPPGPAVYRVVNTLQCNPFTTFRSEDNVIPFIVLEKSDGNLEKMDPRP